MKKILLTGIHGQVGHALQQTLVKDQVIALSREQCDLSQPAQIRALIQQYKPDIIINPAAYTAVDKAETEINLAYAINATAPEVMAEEAKKLGARFIHFSTDYVFDGTQSQAYKESDATNPVSVYGKSKLAGEQAVQAVGGDYLIFRTSWVYAPWGKNFLNTMLRLGSEREQLSVVNDQHGAPTSAIAIARAIQQVLAFKNANSADLSGIYHLTNHGVTTWYAFAVGIFKAYEAKRVESGWPTLKIQSDQVKPISTEVYPTPAKRPAFSSLNNGKLKQTFGVTLPSWEESLAEVIEQKTF